MIVARRVRFALVSVCAALVAGAAFAAPSLVGRDAPEIQAHDWIGGDGRSSLADFRGEVVYLEFWKTHCPASRAEVRHLVKMGDDYARRGLVVIALTGDDDRRALLRFLAHTDASPDYRIALGGASGYAVSKLPYGVLVGADGKVVADTSNGQSISDRDVEAALKPVHAMTSEALEPRAAKRLAFAESLAADGLFLRAEFELREVTKCCAGTTAAKKAEARLRTFADGDAKAELDAQRDVARLAGLAPGFERPAEKVKPADADALSKRLAKKADEIRAKTPRAAALADEWSAIYAEPWR
jgi:thiol-disulfide isomerase/thioredoxin